MEQIFTHESVEASPFNSVERKYFWLNNIERIQIMIFFPISLLYLVRFILQHARHEYDLGLWDLEMSRYMITT